MPRGCELFLAAYAVSNGASLAAAVGLKPGSAADAVAEVPQRDTSDAVPSQQAETMGCAVEDLLSFSYGGDWSAVKVSFIDGVGDVVANGQVDSLCAKDGCYYAAVATEGHADLTFGISKLRAGSKTTPMSDNALVSFCVAGDDITFGESDAKIYDEEIERALLNHVVSSYGSYSYELEHYSYESSYSYSYSYDETAAPTTDTPAPSFAPTTEIDDFSYLYSYLEYSYSYGTKPPTPETASPTLSPTASDVVELDWLLFFDNLAFRGEDFYNTFTELNQDKNELTAVAETILQGVLEYYETEYDGFDFTVGLSDLAYAAFVPKYTPNGDVVDNPIEEARRLRAAAQAQPRRTLTAAQRELLAAFAIPEWYESELVPTEEELVLAAKGYDVDFDMNPKTEQSYAILHVKVPVPKDSNVDSDLVKQRMEVSFHESYETCGIESMYLENVENEVPDYVMEDTYNCDVFEGTKVEVSFIESSRPPTPSPTRAGFNNNDWMELMEDVCEKKNDYYGLKFERFVCPNVDRWEQPKN